MVQCRPMNAEKKPATKGTQKTSTQTEKKDTKQPPKSPRGGFPQMPQGGGFWMQMAITIVVFALMLSAYSAVSGFFKETEDVSLSQLAADINAGLVTEIEVSGSNLEATYPAAGEEGEDLVKKSQKETETSLTETLVNYGVAHESLSQVNLVIADPSGFRYWFGTLAPLLIPVLVIVLIIWYLSRQVKGSGMQAFSFGQSKARMIDPNDSNQKVLFEDVAGAKEAKEELTEIVDFLKNPKKFFQRNRICFAVLRNLLPETIFYLFK